MIKQHIDNALKKNAGFSLIELLVYLVVLGVLMTAVLISFNATMQRSAQQSNISESKIETFIGLELLRADLEHAGFGLPWQFAGIPNYSEPLVPALADAPNNVPRSITSEDNSLSSLNAADYLVIRATNVTRGEAAQKWGYVGRDVSHNIDIQMMEGSNFSAGERAIIIRPESSSGQYRQLIMDGANYAVEPKESAIGNYAPPATPNDPDGERYLIYGFNGDVNTRRPFNRTDYYINNANIPDHCAPNTGILVKATVNQADDAFNVMPILDCVADFQVVYYLDTNADGGWDQRADANGLNGLTADQIRDQVKVIRYYILTHEGGIDRSYRHPNQNINVGEVAPDGVTLRAGRQFVLAGANWANYRWKIESMAISPKNLQ